MGFKKFFSGLPKDLVLIIVATVCLLVFLAVYPPGLDGLDGKLLYSPDWVYSFLASLDDPGREFYVKHEIVDFAFMFFYSLVLYRFFNRTYVLAEKEMPLVIKIIAVLPGIIDVFEDIGIIYLVQLFPGRADGVAIIVSALSTLKWITLVSAVGLCLYRIATFRGKTQ